MEDGCASEYEGGRKAEAGYWVAHMGDAYRQKEENHVELEKLDYSAEK